MKCMKKISTLLVLMLYALLLTAKQTKVLYIGNSYIYVNDLPKVIADIATSRGDTITYTSIAIGGATALSHWSNASVHSAIMQGGWDFVVIQCQSQEPSFPPAQVADETYPYVKKLDSLVQVSNTCAETLFFMTWGRKNGDAINGASYPPIATFEGMTGRLRESYLLFAQDFTASVAPVGVAWQRFRALYPTTELYQTDESHPSMNGTYLTACVFYTSMFHQPTFVAGTYISSGLNNADALAMQQTADQTVMDSINNWQQYGNLPLADYAYQTNNLNVQLNQLSVHATQYEWSFGDNQYSNLPNPSHTYTNSGTYNLCLQVTSNCGKTDRICRAITITQTPNGLQAINTEGLQIFVEGQSIQIKENNYFTQYQLINGIGQVIQQNTLQQRTSIETSMLQGIYFIRLIGPNKVYTKRIWLP